MEQSKPKLLATKLQFKRFFFTEYWAFNLVGFDFSSEQQIFKRPWITVTLIVSGFFFVATAFYHGVMHLNDLDVATEAMAPSLQCVLAVWKFAVVAYKRHEMMDLLTRIWDLINRGSKKDLKVVLKENKAHWSLSLLYWGNCVMAGVVVSLMPIAFGIFFYFRREGYSYETILKATYPIDVTKPLNYLIILVHNLLSVHLTVTASVAVDSLYSWSVYNIVGQLKVSQEKFKALNDSVKSESSGFQVSTDDGCLKKSIIHCIEYHQQTIALAEQLDETFRPVVFLEFTLNSIQLCFIFFLIGRGVKMSLMLFSIVFMFAVLVQMLLYCYPAQYLENESEEVANVVYNLPWWSWPVRERKMLLLSIQRAQRPLKITGIFFDVNMRLFVSVLQTAFSYVTLLKSVAND